MYALEAEMNKKDHMDARPSQYQRRDIIKFIILVILIVTAGIITIKLLPWIISLKDEASREQLTEWIKSFGIWGWLVALGIQIMQVVIAIIPGEPIEIIMGMIYGTVGGMLTCLFGVLIGTIMIFYMVKGLGYGFVTAVVSEEKLHRFKFMQTATRLDLVIFILFFIPGTPKDLLTFFVPLTPIKPMRFFLISTVARIPSVVSSTFLGASINRGNWIIALIVFILTGVVGIAGIIINDKYLKSQERKEKLLAKHHEKSNQDR